MKGAASGNIHGVKMHGGQAQPGGSQEKFSSTSRKKDQTAFPTLLALFLAELATDETVPFICGLVLWGWIPATGVRLMIAIALGEWTNICLKWIFREPRIFWLYPGMNIHPRALEDDFAFPSSHAQMFSSIATVLAIEYIKLAQIYSQGDGRFFSTTTTVIVGALTIYLTSWARVHLNVHSIKDVTVGSLLGVLGSVLVIVTDPGEWLADPINVTDSMRFAVAGVVLVVGYGLPILICTYVGTVSEVQLSLWQSRFDRAKERGTKASPNAQAKGKRDAVGARDITKLDFVVTSTVGSIVAATIWGFRDHNLRFFSNERCIWSRHSWAMCVRFVVGAAGNATVLVLKSKVGKKTALSRFVRRLLYFAMGMWVIYGAPKLSDVSFGAYCGISPHVPWAEPRIISPTGAEVSPDLAEWFDYYPTPQMRDRITPLYSLSELQETVTRSSEDVVVVGSGYSELTRKLQDNVRPVRLVARPSNAFGNVTVLERYKDGGARVRAGAGLLIDADPRQPDGHSLSRILWSQGLSLPVFGGVSWQTLGGFLSTGSEGSSLTDSMLKSVRAVRIVDHSGFLHELRADDQGFQYAVASNGVSGVIVDVEVDVVSAFCVLSTVKFSDSEQDGTESFLDLSKNDNGRVILVPTPTETLSQAYSTKRVPCTEKELATVVDPFSQKGAIAKDNELLDYFFHLGEAALAMKERPDAKNSTGSGSFKKLLTLLDSTNLGTTLLEIVDRDIEKRILFEQCLDSIHTFFVNHYHGAKAKVIEECFLRPISIGLGGDFEETKTGPAHIVLPFDFELNVTINDVKQTEIWFPLNETSDPSKIIKTIVKHAEDSPLGIYVETCVGAAQSSFPLAPSYVPPDSSITSFFRVNIIIPMATFDPADGIAAGFWNAALEAGWQFRFHLGKIRPDPTRPDHTRAWDMLVETEGKHWAEAKQIFGPSKRSTTSQ